MVELHSHTNSGKIFDATLQHILFTSIRIRVHREVVRMFVVVVVEDT